MQILINGLFKEQAGVIALYLFDLRWITFFFALRKLRMRQQNTNRAVPLDAVPERRTERCSPGFRPGDRFCGPSVRYLSPGSEGEKCRPLRDRSLSFTQTD